MKNKETSFDEYLEAPDDEEVYKLKLFVTGATPNSAQAIANITNICEEHLTNRYDLEVIDIYQQPSKARDQEITAVPLLVKYSPLPLKRLIGNMSDTFKVLRGLGLNT
jgi:circadian clock protein KaiB